MGLFVNTPIILLITIYPLSLATIAKSTSLAMIALLFNNLK